MERRRFKQSASLDQRLLEQAERLRKEGAWHATGCRAQSFCSLLGKRRSAPT